MKYLNYGGFFLAILLALVMGIVGSSYWYIPLVVYLVAATLTIIIIAAWRGNLAKLPYCIIEALKIIKEKRQHSSLS